MSREQATNRRLRAGALGWPSLQLAVTGVILTLVWALFFINRRHSSSPEQALQRSVGAHSADPILDHPIHHLRSHQQLKRSNLWGGSFGGSNRIKGAALPDRASQDTELDLTKNGNGFLSNVAEAQSSVSGVSMTAAPVVDSKPLGFYFSKDIPGDMREKAMGLINSTDSSEAVDGKAAMSLYFNQGKPDKRDVDAVPEVHKEYTTADGAHAQHKFQ